MRYLGARTEEGEGSGLVVGGGLVPVSFGRCMATGEGLDWGGLTRASNSATSCLARYVLPEQGRPQMIMSWSHNGHQVIAFLAIREGGRKGRAARLTGICPLTCGGRLRYMEIRVYSEIGVWEARLVMLSYKKCYHFLLPCLDTIFTLLRISSRGGRDSRDGAESRASNLLIWNVMIDGQSDRCAPKPPYRSQHPRLFGCIEASKPRSSLPFRVRRIPDAFIHISEACRKVSAAEQRVGNPMAGLIGVRLGSKKSFLFESAATTETIGRYSFIGAG